MKCESVYQLGESRLLVTGLPFGRLLQAHCELCNIRVAGPTAFPLVPGSAFQVLLDRKRDPGSDPEMLSWQAFKSLISENASSITLKGELRPVSTLGPFSLESDAIDAVYATDLISVSPGNPMLRWRLIEEILSKGINVQAQRFSLNVGSVGRVDYGMIHAPAMRLLHGRTLQEARRVQCHECGMIKVLDYRIGVPATLYLDERFRDPDVPFFQLVGMEGGIYVSAPLAGLLKRLAPGVPLRIRGDWL